MHHFTFKLTVALLTFLIGMAVAAVRLIKRPSIDAVPQKVQPASAAQEEGALRLSIPTDGWEPIFFESINGRAGVAGLASLRTVGLPKDDLEVRVWVGFGVSALEGFVLKRAKGRWSATHLEGVHRRLPKSEYQKVLQTPKSGWDAAWQRLVDAGILTLPDASAVGCSAGINDGMSYVVEVNKDKAYRTYMYDNPDHATCVEAEQMLKVVEIIAEEFGVEEFRLGE
jgi:hypothetical protein